MPGATLTFPGYSAMWGASPVGLRVGWSPWNEARYVMSHAKDGPTGESVEKVLLA